MNHCDHGHQTYGEIRRLPTGGGGAINVCYDCYWKEIPDWRRRNPDKRPPAWSSLEVVAQRWDTLSG